MEEVFASGAFDRRDEFLRTFTEKPESQAIHLDLKCIENGWEDIYFNHGINVDTFKLYGRDCTFGFVTHAPSRVEIPLNGVFKQFHCYVGQENSDPPWTKH